jgi:prepilin-type N-terminal cleavage/methylation domain-containing protein/prepilin-type processing-associated H-X9-DG protein
MEKRMKPKDKSGFTLIELLVVIAIIAILASILLPVFISAKESSKASACIGNLRQIGGALMMYVQDHDDTFSHCEYRYGPGGAYICDAWDWGKWFWMFTCKPYLGTRYPSDWRSGNPGRNIFSCPANPTFHKLIRGGQLNVLYRGGLDKKWGLTLGPIPGETRPGYAIWCSYGINEHIPYASWKYRDWQRPSRSYLLLEARDTELTGDQLGDKFCYDAHAGGTNFLYIDGHAKWSKSVYSGNPGDPNPQRRKSVEWSTPLGGPWGGLGALPSDTGRDRGPWTATASDDY